MSNSARDVDFAVVILKLFEKWGVDFEESVDKATFARGLARTLSRKFGKPLYPKPGDSMALSVATPKTAALAFDRIYSIPTMRDPIPDDIGFYYATPPEMAWWGLGLLALTVNKEFQIPTLDQSRGSGDAGQNEIESLKFVSSEFPEEHGSVAMLYANAAQCDRDFPAGPRSILRAAISNVAIVDETDLSWEQIREFRNDAETQNKYRRFVRWIDHELLGRSLREMEDILAIRLNDYEWALKKHGIKAVLGALSSLLDPKFLGTTSAAVASAAVAGGPMWAAIAGATLTVGQAAISFGSATVEGIDQRRKENYEIAYVYEVKKQLGSA